MKLPFRVAPIGLGLLAALMAAAAPAVRAAEEKAAFKADPARGQQLTQTCIACHTADGSRGAAANPILQGQHAAYIVKQLTEFKSGRRKSAIMQGMAAPLSEDDIRHIAAFYSGKSAKPGFAKAKDTVVLGEQIYRGGVTTAKVPACAGCHSPNGAGIPAQFPRLAGQHAEYTEAQLTAFRNGVRGNSAQMASIAASLGEREAKAVADYIAGLR